MDIVHRIRTFNAGRDPARLSLKYRAMRASSYAFLRGTCHLFYDRLPRNGVFKSAPPVWACGDLHVENFGSYKADNRLVYFDLNDFDEAALAPCTWDLVRLLTSLLVGADDLSLGGRLPRTLCRRVVDAYATALVSGKPLWVERETATGLIRSLLDKTRLRDRARLLASRTTLRGKQRRLLVEGGKALPASKQQRAMITRFMRAFARTQPNPAFYEVLDVARRIAGTASLGIDRYVILIQGKGSPDRNYLLDLKQALRSSLVAHLTTEQPAWRTEAHRVVALQQRVQAMPMAFLHAAVLEGQAYVLRELQPSEDRIRFSSGGHTKDELEQLVVGTGRLVAWAQLRAAGREGSATADELIDFGRRRKWKEQLLEASHTCAEQLRKDARLYKRAYDDGAFGS